MRPVALLVSLTATLLGGCSSPPPDPPALPAAADIERVTVTVFGTVSKRNDLAEFEVPAEFVPGLLRTLTPPEYHEHVAVREREVVAWIHLHCRDGRVLDVELLYSGHGVIQYTVQGVPCRRKGVYSDVDTDQGVSLAEVVQVESYLRAVHRGDAAKARECLSHIDRAAQRDR
jgi:hypothetical protein